MLTESIEGRYLNIVANSSVKEEIRNCFHSANVAIADLPITVQALADTMLTESERRSGCVFIDMGAETTSVAVYKNNIILRQNNRTGRSARRAAAVRRSGIRIPTATGKNTESHKNNKY